MDFFNKLSKRSKEVAGKTKDMVEIVKLNTKISDEEKKKRAIYTEIGEMYVDNIEQPEVMKVDAQLQNINLADDRINDYKHKIAKIKKIKYCTQCGEPVHDDAVFCCKCGAKMPESVMSEVQDIVVESTKAATAEPETFQGQKEPEEQEQAQVQKELEEQEQAQIQYEPEEQEQTQVQKESEEQEQVQIQYKPEEVQVEYIPVDVVEETIDEQVIQEVDITENI